MPELPPKLPYEPLHDYYRFICYLRLGKKRSLYAAYCDFCKQYGIAINKSLPYDWTRAFKAWNWDDRCASFDAEWEEEERKQAVARKNMIARRWKSRAEEARERKWQMRETLYEKVERMVNTPIDQLNWKIRDMLDIIEQISALDEELLPSAIAEVKAIADLKDAGIIPAETAEQIDNILNDAYNQVRSLLSSSNK